MSDPFDVLGLPPMVPVDPAALERAWLRRAAAVHPDGAAPGDDALAEVARCNAAKEILADPERAANALLARHGGPTASEDDALPEGLLMEMLELRDALESAVDAARAGDASALERLREEVAARRAACAAEVHALLGGPAAQDEAARRAARQALNAWRYVERLAGQIDDALP